MTLFSRAALIRTGKIAAVAAVTVGSMAMVGAASAATTTVTDARGEIAHGADLHGVRVVNDHALRIMIKHDDLVRSYRSGSGLAVFVDTKPRRSGPEYVFLGGTFEGSDYALLKADGWKPASRRAEPLQCGYIMNLDYAKDTARVKIDQDCIGDPDRVRVAVRTSGETENGFVHDWLEDRREFTDWVARG